MAGCRLVLFRIVMSLLTRLGVSIGGGAGHRFRHHLLGSLPAFPVRLGRAGKSVALVVVVALTAAGLTTPAEATPKPAAGPPLPTSTGPIGPDPAPVKVSGQVYQPQSPGKQTTKIVVTPPAAGSAAAGVGAGFVRVGGLPVSVAAAGAAVAAGQAAEPGIAGGEGGGGGIGCG